MTPCTFHGDKTEILADCSAFLEQCFFLIAMDRNKSKFVVAVVVLLTFMLLQSWLPSYQVSKVHFFYCVIITVFVLVKDPRDEMSYPDKIVNLRHLHLERNFMVTICFKRVVV